MKWLSCAYRICSTHLSLLTAVFDRFVAFVWYTGGDKLLKPSRDANIENRASYTGDHSCSADTGFSVDGNAVDGVEKKSVESQVSSSRQKSRDRDALLCDTD